MGWTYVEALARRRRDPAVGDPAAWKHDRVLAVPIDDRHLQILVGRHKADSFPHDASVLRRQPSLRPFALGQFDVRAVGRSRLMQRKKDAP
jgi:hypothetical protein